MTSNKKLLATSCVMTISVFLAYPNIQETYAGKTFSKISLDEAPSARKKPASSHSSQTGDTAATSALRTVMKELREDSHTNFKRGEHPVTIRGGTCFTPSYEVPFSMETVLKRVIPGHDGRFPVLDTEAPEYRVHGKLEITFSDQEGNKILGGGSGTLISPCAVLTAGHCLFSRKYGWAERVEFFPGRNKETNPYGQASGSILLSVSGWVDSHNARYDMGVLILDKPIGMITGWLGVCHAKETDIKKTTKVHITGYPGDKGNSDEMWTMSHHLKGITEQSLVYEIDTAPGQSGSGVCATLIDKTTQHVIGIHSYGFSTHNLATRITLGKFRVILNWLESYQLAVDRRLTHSTGNFCSREDLAALEEPVSPPTSSEHMLLEEEIRQKKLTLAKKLSQQARALGEKLYYLMTCCISKK